MKVLYDYQIFQMQNFGGISRYFFELINHATDTGLESDLAVLLSANEYLRESPEFSEFKKISNNMQQKIYRGTDFLNSQYSRHKLRFSNYEVFHPTFFETYFLDTIKKPFVLTVYDLINELFPEYFKNNEDFLMRRKLLIEKATRIIAISEHTKQDIIKQFGIPESKIDVTYLAESISEISSTIVPNLPSKYILFIGKRSGYKNFSTAYRAISEVLKNNPEINLVCAGGGRFAPLEIELFSSDKIVNQVVYIPFSKSSELKFIYENALLFIFPSLYEGFGIPILESFAAGCLVCSSQTSSLVEIAKQGAIYFDPESVDSIGSAVDRALDLPKINKYTTYGKEEVAKYSWLKTTEQTRKVYEKC